MLEPGLETFDDFQGGLSAFKKHKALIDAPETVEHQFSDRTSDRHGVWCLFRYVPLAVRAGQDDSDGSLAEEDARHASQGLPEKLRIFLVQNARCPLCTGTPDIFGVDEVLGEVCCLIELVDDKRRVLCRTRAESADERGIAFRGLRRIGELIDLGLELLGQGLENHARGKDRSLAHNKVRGKMTGLPPVAKSVSGRTCGKQGLGQRESGSLN